MKVVLIFLTVFFGAFANADLVSNPIDMTLQIKNRVSKSSISNIKGVLVETAMLKSFYTQRGYRAAWVENQMFSQKAFKLIEIIQKSNLHGLRPQDYIRNNMMTKLQVAQVQELPDYEVLLSYSFLLYVKDLSVGRTKPADFGRESKFPSKTFKEYKFLAQLVDQDINYFESGLNSLAPQFDAYKNLQQALAQLTTIKTQGGWKPLQFSQVLKLNIKSPEVTLLRERLAIEGYYADFTDPELFDLGLQNIVMLWQEMHKIKPDGSVGKVTLEKLNISVDARINQIEANLERLRWLPSHLGNRYAWVNTALGEMKVIENGSPVLEMKIVTGKFYRQTPLLVDEIKHVVFNPYWYAPRGIAVSDLVPKIVKDPLFLANNKYTVIENDAITQTYDSSTWDQYKPNEFPYDLRQEPGPLNALGIVKFRMTNPYSIYLHDTAHREYFAEDIRFYSSGCIRIEKPVEFAQYLLNDPTKWTKEEIFRITGLDENGNYLDPMPKVKAEDTITLVNPLRVYTVYQSVERSTNGLIRYSLDDYGWDYHITVSTHGGEL